MKTFFDETMKEKGKERHMYSKWALNQAATSGSTLSQAFQNAVMTDSMTV